MSGVHMEIRRNSVDRYELRDKLCRSNVAEFLCRAISNEIVFGHGDNRNWKVAGCDLLARQRDARREIRTKSSMGIRKGEVNTMRDLVQTTSNQILLRLL